ncbi:MAG: hypothetical protein ABIH23_18985 [bacterium]
MKPKKQGAYFDPARSVDLVGSGCALLDCCLGGGWAERVVNLVGDKSTGKTLLACELAANYLVKYPTATVWYREVEAAFDEDYIRNMGIPADKFDMSCTSFSVEDVFEELQRLIGQRKHGLYVIDSLDALSDRAEIKRGMDEGTYGAEKAKKLSQLFRRLIQGLSTAKIMVLVVSQVRDKIGVTFGERHTRSGGRALDFYASQVVFLSQIKTLKRGVKSVERPVGIQVRAKVKKNKVGLPFRECEFPILFGYGVEDVVAGVEWLVEVKALSEAGIDPADARRWSSLRDVARMDKKDYDVCRRRVSRGVKKVWRRIESDFAPVRLKY